MNLQYIPYDSQRDNPVDPNKTCYPTSIAMVIRSLEQKHYGGQARNHYIREDFEEWLINHLIENRSKYRKTTYNLIKQKWAMKIYPRYVGAFWVWFINNKLTGFKAKYQYFSRKKLKRFIAIKQIPVVTSTKLTGRGGHIVVTKGFSSKGFYCHDPFGNASNYKKNHYITC